MPTPKLPAKTHRQIHELVAQGDGPREVAKKLTLSHATVIKYQALPLPAAGPNECPHPLPAKSRPVLQIEKPGVWGVLSDMHVPYHDWHALNSAVNYLKKRDPDGLLINGDFLDCVTPETRVLTHDLRWVPAGELRVGDKLVAFDEHCGPKNAGGKAGMRKMRYSHVESNRRAMQPIYALHMDDGTVVRCSPGHKWLGWKSAKKNQKALEWMTAEEIKVRVAKGRPVVLNRPVRPWEQERDYTSGYIAGAFDGEGSICFHSRANNFGHLCFTQLPNVFLDKVEAAVQSKGFRTYRNTHETRGTTQLTLLGGMWAQAEFIGRFDIPRFREKWASNAPIDGYRLAATHRAQVVRVVEEGEGEIIVLQTSSATYFAEGFCSHNCHELSEHDKDPTAARYVDELEAGKQMFAWLRKQFPRARIVYRFGNHEERLDRYILRRAPALFDLPYADVRTQLDLAGQRVELVRDKRLIRLGKLNTIHGHEYRGSGGINPARWLHLRTHAATMCGHFHRPSFHPWRTVDGASSGCWSLGCLCHLQPDYAVNNEWNHGFAVVTVGKGGAFEVESKLIINGRVC